MKKLVLDKTAFVRHPVLPELKRKLNSEGYQIVDAAFAPEGETILDGSASEGAKTPTKSPVKTAKPNEIPGAAADALALAGGNFMAFKSAAKKILSDALPGTKDEIIAALKAYDGGADGTPTPIPEAWEAMTDDELVELAGKLAGEPVNAGSEGSPADKARSIIQATVDDRASRA
ncbi:hypothetical protein [Devosia epidermidihirudinis]|nr:hypothetical protein [Devosia epidermidihirudinis]